MKKIAVTIIFALFFSSAPMLFAEVKAFEIVQEATKKNTADEAALYVAGIVKTIENPTERRAVYAFLGSLQEQLGLYDRAELSYLTAAGIGATDAEKMPRKTNEQLVIDAVRCALNAGNYASADSYLNSAVKNSSSEKIQNYVKLYSVWSELCKAETQSDLEKPLELLKNYANKSEMKEVQPAVLLTLWYITGENSYSDEIKRRFPASPEASIVKGDSQILPSPFWYFVPKVGQAIPESGTVKAVSSTTESTKPENNSVATSATAPAPKNKPHPTKARLQLGFFSSEANAKSLTNELNRKGFQAYIEQEKRPSGNIYFMVLIDENDGTISEKLRSNGYECYLVN